VKSVSLVISHGENKGVEYIWENGSWKNIRVQHRGSRKSFGELYIQEF